MRIQKVYKFIGSVEVDITSDENLWTTNSTLQKQNNNTSIISDELEDVIAKVLSAVETVKSTLRSDDER